MKGSANNERPQIDPRLYALQKSQRTILRAITDERVRQNVKFTRSRVGVQRHNIMYWNAILGEERGESERAMVELVWGPKDQNETVARMEHLREELIQTAAVIVAIVERIDADDEALLAPEGAFPDET